MGEQQQAPGAKDLWARVAQATEGSESMAIWPNTSRGDAVLGLDRGKDPIRRLDEGGGQPASGPSGTGCASAGLAGIWECRR
jgi:hypothetical protein